MTPDYDRNFCEQSKWMYGRGWYIASWIVLLIGYAVGGLLPFGIQFLGWLPELASTEGRLTLTYFGIGILGATMQCNAYFAKDVNKVMYSPEFKPPCFLDPFGYAVHIVGGGITGILMVIAVKTGFFLTVSSSSGTAMRLPAAVIIAFCGGLATYRVRTLFATFVEKFGQKKPSPELPPPDHSKQAVKTAPLPQDHSHHESPPM